MLFRSDENLFTALDDLPSDDTRNHRDLEPSRDINVPLPLGLGQIPNQPFPQDDEHLSRHSSPSTTPWFPQTDDLSPLQLYHDTPDGSEDSLPSSYATSPLCPSVKCTQPETGHRSSISDQHQHKRLDGRYVLLRFASRNGETNGSTGRNSSYWPSNRATTETTS